MKPTFKEKQQTLFARQKALRKEPTISELAFKKRLENLGINFIFQKCFIAGDNYCIVDFYLPKPFKLVIEVDGPYHDLKCQKSRDRNRDYYLTKTRGFKVLRIKNDDVDTVDLSFLLGPVQKPFTLYKP